MKEEINYPVIWRGGHFDNSYRTSDCGITGETEGRAMNFGCHDFDIHQARGIRDWLANKLRDGSGPFYHAGREGDRVVWTWNGDADSVCESHIDVARDREHGGAIFDRNQAQDFLDNFLNKLP